MLKDMSMRAGLAREEITVFEPDMVMFGWGDPDNRARRVGAPLHARALALETPDRRMMIIAVELGMVSIALREAVLERLADEEIDSHGLLIGATHTHSGPSGYTEYLGYNAASFGFSTQVFDHLVEGITAAARAALARLEPAVLRVGSATIPVDEPVAFQRSPRGYLSNSDVLDDKDPAQWDTRDRARAINRETVTLRIDSVDGRPMGVVNWFGVHGTSIHSDHDVIHSDNKGVAASLFEADVGGDFVSLFLQESAGDVSPNFRWHDKRARTVGIDDDDLEAVRKNGEIQFRWAKRAMEHAATCEPLSPELGGCTEHLHLPSHVGPGGMATHTPRIGLAAAAGTDEGPGPLRPLLALIRMGAKVRRFAGVGKPGPAWLTLGAGIEGRFLGMLPTRVGFFLMASALPMVQFVRAADEAGLVGRDPWVPVVLPVQVLRIGEFALANFPGEPTTTSGRRLRAALGRALGRAGVNRCVLTTYANGYAGYIATPEEYRAQQYEGAATLFGEGTLDAYTHAMLRVAESPADPGAPVEGPEVRRPDRDHLMRRREVGRSGLRVA